MEKAVVTLLIRLFRGGQAAIAHYLFVLSYYIIAVTGGGCFERTEISFISFRWRIQRSVAITYPFEEQPDSTRQIHRWSWRRSLQGAVCQEKEVQNQIYLNTKRDRLHDVPVQGFIDFNSSRYQQRRSPAWRSGLGRYWICLLYTSDAADE